jgi:hypothetical protein
MWRSEVILVVVVALLMVLLVPMVRHRRLCRQRTLLAREEKEADIAGRLLTSRRCEGDDETAVPH